jgi:hypothetical protein
MEGSSPFHARLLAKAPQISEFCFLPRRSRNRSRSTAAITRNSGTVYSLTITTSRLTPQGEYVFTVTAAGGGMSASANATLIVLV